jgi:hypothetical protein
LLLRQFIAKGKFPSRDVPLIAPGIDKDRRDTLLEPLVFGFHVEVAAVGAEKVIAR